MHWIYLKSSVNAPCLVSLLIHVIDSLTTEVSFKRGLTVASMFFISLVIKLAGHHSSHDVLTS